MTSTHLVRIAWSVLRPIGINELRWKLNAALVTLIWGKYWAAKLEGSLIALDLVLKPSLFFSSAYVMACPRLLGVDAVIILFLYDI